jgi:hypothetical protein
MKQSNAHAYYVGQEFPDKVGQIVRVKNRIGSSSAFNILFTEDQIPHECNRSFLIPTSLNRKI